MARKWGEGNLPTGIFKRLTCVEHELQEKCTNNEKKEKLKWVLVIGRLKFQGQLQEKEALLCCFLFSIIKMRCIYEIKQSKRRRRTLPNNEKGAFCLNNAYYLIIWSVGSIFFTIGMPNQVVYYQKGRGKVGGDQHIAVSACHCPWPGRFIFRDLQES